MSINAPAIDDKRFSTLQAAAATRGITLYRDMLDGNYMVGSGVYFHVADDYEALVELLARMGVIA